MSWETKRLGSVATLMSGGTPRKNNELYWDGDIPWFSAKDLTRNYLNDSKLHVTEEGVSNGTRLVPANTVLFVVRGMSLAKEFRVSLSTVPATFNQDLKALTCKKGINPKFVFYSLFAQRNTIRQMAGEASHGTKKLPTEVVVEIPIKTPDLITQDRVVEVAEKYDLLIENNRRRIHLLEESARLLYKEWFIHFRFPGYERIKVVNGVPEGWAKKTLGEITSYLNRGMTPKYSDDGEFSIINQKCIRNRSLSMQLSRRQSKPFNDDKLVLKGDVLINSTGTGTLGRVAQCWVDMRKTTVDTHVTILRPKSDIPLWWFGYAVLEFEKLFEGMGEGATNQKELKRALVAEIPVLLGTSPLMDSFSEIVSSNIRQIVVLSEQNVKLIQARDLLLPRLMNGEIKV